ncbi:MAG: EF-hand domain-containing protein [Pseudoalteromonas sp.]|uniref:calcium-binding protein n=1 Tax=unclassified Pseudoalteromonas TaxID=194690 RepID=UPI000C08066D|nr:MULTISPECIES: calcium-binding protein [unclassified Pseudoalteromonas]MDB2355888.1 EF-hand domain-containing protein [Pseudoalteromonas sp.]MDP2634063.1 EF-hand domain-containing protein [Pseudoalteromonas sp. 1_MG-2023]PHN90707.1 calcium-binding protein [Pseudoalteromonas sp. 3D05]
MNKQNIIVLPLLLLTSFSGFAMTNTQADTFKALDKNEDGLLTRAETARDPALWSRFNSYDTDKDSRLSLAEFSVYANK